MRKSIPAKSIIKNNINQYPSFKMGTKLPKNTRNMRHLLKDYSIIHLSAIHHHC